MLLLDVELQVYVRTEALPAVETEEWSLSRVSYQVMLQTYRDLERSVALGTDLVLGAALRVYQMTEAVEHYLVPRIELVLTSVTVFTSLTSNRIFCRTDHRRSLL